MQTVKDFMNELGGTVEVAAVLGVPISTVSGWNLSNRIPHWRVPAVKALAKKLGKQFPAEFAPLEKAA